MVRYLSQAGFLGLTLAAVFWVGANAELWCPFGGAEALYTYATEGNLPCSLGVSNLYIFAAVLGMTLMARRVFCSHACPLGTVYEWTFRAGRRLKLPSVPIPERVDRILSLAKYVLLVVILILTYRAAELIFRGFDPCYALLSRHGEDITFWAYVVAGATLVGALFMRVPFCRWLCPLAALLQPFSRFGWTRVRRDEGTCIDCGKCTRACMMGIRVHDRAAVTDARCTSCGECVGSCPVSGGDTLKLTAAGSKRRWPRAAAAAVALVWIGLAVAGAKLAPAPSFTYERAEASAADPVTVEYALEELTCRGRATLLVFFLDRDDEYELPGYLRLEAWPGPATARIRVTCDRAALTDDPAGAIELAITEPYFNLADNRWYTSPFVIVRGRETGDR